MPNPIKRAENLTDGHKAILALVAIIAVMFFLHGASSNRPGGSRQSLVRTSYMAG
jgi:hypothetical protein